MAQSLVNEEGFRGGIEKIRRGQVQALSKTNSYLKEGNWSLVNHGTACAGRRWLESARPLYILGDLGQVSSLPCASVPPAMDRRMTAP